MPNVVKLPVHKHLSHLSQDQINTLIDKYINTKERVADLIEFYQLAINSRDLVSILPPQLSDSNVCPYCHLFMFKKIKSRSDIYKNYDFCFSCQHTINPDCKCSNCLNKIAQYQQEKNNIKIKLLDAIIGQSSSVKVNVNEISFVDRIYLALLIKFGAEEDLSRINQIKSFTNKFAPLDYDSKIIWQLIERNIIFLHEDNKIEKNLKKIDLVKEEGKYKVVVDSLNLFFEIRFDKTYRDKWELLDELLDIDFSNEIKPITDLWKEISIQECEEYFFHKLGSSGFEAEEELYSIIRELFSRILSNYSTAQIFGIIYSCMAKSIMSYSESKLFSRKNVATNTLIGIEKYYLKALKNSWELNRYNWPNDLERSLISVFYFNDVLKVGEKGFNINPNINNIKISENHAT